MKRSKGLALWALPPLVLAALALPGSLRAQGNFVYTNNDVNGPNTVSGFSVASNGTLTLIPGSPFATGGTGGGFRFIASNDVTVSTAGNFLFASNGGSNDVSVFSINASTGTLSLVAGSPFPTGGSAVLGISLSTTPDDQLAHSFAIRRSAAFLASLVRMKRPAPDSQFVGYAVNRVETQRRATSERSRFMKRVRFVGLDVQRTERSDRSE